MENLKYLEALPTKELKQIQARIAKTLKEREEECEKVMHQYQEELDRLVDAIEGDGFFVCVPDFPTRPIKIMKREND